MARTEASRLLRQARRASGVSQTELARRAGISHSVLSAYENGRRDPGSRALARLLDAAGYRLTVSRVGVDVERAGQTLSELLRLVDALPSKPRGALEFPGVPRDRVDG